MKKFIAVLVSLFLAALSGAGFAEETTGEGLFKKHCALCHPNGGNIIRPEKTLLKKDLEMRGIKTPQDIVNVMRNPGKGMKTFSEDKLSDPDAQEIADYILKTF